MFKGASYFCFTFSCRAFQETAESEMKEQRLHKGMRLCARAWLCCVACLCVALCEVLCVCLVWDPNLKGTCLSKSFYSTSNWHDSTKLKSDMKWFITAAHGDKLCSLNWNTTERWILPMSPGFLNTSDLQFSFTQSLPRVSQELEPTHWSYRARQTFRGTSRNQRGNILILKLIFL